MRKKAGKLVAIFLVVLMLCALFPFSAAFAADEWEGYTAISSQEDLEKIADDMSGKYYLTTDITLEGIWTPLGLGVSGSYTDKDFSGVPFKGIIDGNGHTIYGMNTGKLETYAGVGLVAALHSSGAIRNLTISNANVYARYWAGAIAGLNNGTIENCHVVDSVIAGREGSNPQTEYNYVGGSQIGGITGWNCASGHITDCSVMTTSVLGNRFIGGIAGANNGLIEKTFVRDCAPSDDGSSTSCWIGSKYYKVNGSRSTALQLHENYLIYSQGSNAPYMMVGGLVGSNDSDAGTGTIRNCYVTNTQINSIDGMGELMGANWGVVENCYTAENGLAYYSSDSWYSGGSRFDWSPDYVARNYNAMSGSTNTGVHYYARETYNSGTGTRHYMGDGMKTQSTYAGWDFENIWTLDEDLTQVNYGYPVFGASAPAAPTDNEIKNLLANFKVVIDCTNKYVEHADGEYGLIDGSYTKGSVQGSQASGYTYSIQIQPDKYVEKYNTDMGIAHMLDPANQQGVTISFTFDTTAKAWKLAAGTASKATFTVLCDTEPAAPTADEIKNLLANFKVVIDCTNKYVEHADGEYGLIDGSYTKGSVQGSQASGYTYSIQIQPDKYVEKYNTDMGIAHMLVPVSQQGVTISFTYDTTAKAWKLAAGTASKATFTVLCERGPAAPTDNEIKNLLANYKIVIDCTNEYVEHADGEYGLIDGSYLRGSVQGTYGSGYTYSILIQPGKYVEKYNTDMGITHRLDPENQQGAAIGFTFDTTAKAWKLAAGTASKATFTVLCDTAPAAPTADEIKNLLANFKVVIDCTNEKAEHADGEYGLIDGSYTKGSVQGSQASGYTYSIQIQPGKYVVKYNEDTGADHSLAPENQADTVLTFTFDKETKTWKTAPSLEDAIYTVECISEPTVGYVWLSYESNGGTEYPSEQYIQGTLAVLDKVPVREGYYFTGWYRDQELTDRITEIYMVLDRTVYAGWEKVTVPAMLNGSDHFAYITGYADGTVRPDADITRAEVATIFFRLLKDEVRAQYLTSENSFADVNEGDWFNQAVSTMAALGIVDGRTDDSFAPNEAITRAEFAAICARFAAYDGAAANSFTDIAGHWAEDEITCAAALGWVDGYNDGSFRPDKNISRAEAMTLINRVLQRVPENTDDLLDGMTTWVDNTDENMWYYLAVQEATNSHDYVRKGFVYESWTALKADPDWEKYEN